MPLWLAGRACLFAHPPDSSEVQGSILNSGLAIKEIKLIDWGYDVGNENVIGFRTLEYYTPPYLLSSSFRKQQPREVNINKGEPLCVRTCVSVCVHAFGWAGCVWWISWVLLYINEAALFICPVCWTCCGRIHCCVCVQLAVNTHFRNNNNFLEELNQKLAGLAVGAWIAASYNPLQLYIWSIWHEERALAWKSLFSFASQDRVAEAPLLIMCFFLCVLVEVDDSGEWFFAFTAFVATSRRTRQLNLIWLLFSLVSPSTLHFLWLSSKSEAWAIFCWQFAFKVLHVIGNCSRSKNLTSFAELMQQIFILKLHDMNIIM